MLLARLRSPGVCLSRRFCDATTATPVKQSWSRYLLRGRMVVPVPLALAGLYSINDTLQKNLGSKDDFFHGSFITTKDPDAIAEFYQAEDLLRIIAIFPFMFDLVMNKVQPDCEEATEETALLSLGETHFTVSHVGMEVSFQIIEQEEEDDNGESALKSFIRHERFFDWFPLLADVGIKLMMWDQTWKYGFTKLDDGRFEVYHHGESFFGPWFVRLIVMVHQRYVLWACQNYIQSEAFGSDDDDLMDKQQEQMANIPLWKYQEFLTNLKTEQMGKIMALKNEVKMSSDRRKAALAEAEDMLGKIDKLSAMDAPAVQLARKEGAMKASFGGSGENVRIVVSDQDMQDVVEAARGDAKGNRAINAALQDLTKGDNLNWELKGTDRRSSKRSKKSSS